MTTKPETAKEPSPKTSPKASPKKSPGRKPGTAQASPTHGRFDKKKGVAKFGVDDEDQQQYLDYQPMKPEVLNWEELKSQANFAVKCYKDSVYRGQLDE